MSLSNEKYALKNLDEIKSQIQNATVIQLDYGNILPLSLKSNDIKEVSLNKIEMAYLANSYDSKVYQPVYLLEGESEVSNKPSPVNIIVLLPALEN